MNKHNAFKPICHDLTEKKRSLVNLISFKSARWALSFLMHEDLSREI